MAEYIDREAFKKSVEDDFCSYGKRKGEPMTVKDYYETIRDIERLAALVDAEGDVTLDHDDAEQIWALLLDYKDLLMAKEVG